MLEDKIKAILGEYAFQISVLQHNLDEANKKITELEKEKNDKSNSD